MEYEFVGILITIKLKREYNSVFMVYCGSDNVFATRLVAIATIFYEHRIGRKGNPRQIAEHP